MADKTDKQRKESERDEEDGEQPEDEFGFDAEYDFEDWQDIPEEEASRILKGLESLIPDIVKRTMGGVLASEEGLRSVFGDKNIPKEFAGFLLGQVDATRRGVLRIVSREFRIFLENMDFGGEIAKILTSLSFEVRTEIRFIPNEERVVPSIKNRVRVKRRGEDEDAAPEGEDDEPPPEKADETKAPEAKKPASRWTRRRADDE